MLAAPEAIRFTAMSSRAPNAKLTESAGDSEKLFQSMIDRLAWGVMT